MVSPRPGVPEPKLLCHCTLQNASGGVSAECQVMSFEQGNLEPGQFPKKLTTAERPRQSGREPSRAAM